MKLVLTTILFLSIASSKAQFNLNKLKSKAEETVKKEENKKEKSTSGNSNNTTTPMATSSNSSKSSGKANIDASPAASSIRNYRNALSFCKDAVEGKHNDADDRLKKLEQLLAKIKSEDPNWAEYGNDESAYLDLKSMQEKNKSSTGIKDRLNNFDSYMYSSEHESTKATLSHAEFITRKYYDDIKQYYDAHPELVTDYETKIFNKAEKFYANVMPKLKEDVMINAIDKGFETTGFFIKEKRAKSDYLLHVQSDIFDPKGNIKTIDEYIINCDQALVMIPNDPDFLKKKSLYMDRKADLQSYISSGEYAKDVDKRKQMDIDMTLLSKAAMNNPQYDAIVKRDMNVSAWGTIQRISIISADWIIIKNELGLPLKKVLNVETANKKDGKCYYIQGNIACVYEGGGKYGNPHYYTDNDMEMNCGNINKNAP